MNIVKRLNFIHEGIRNCKACPNMCGTPVHGPALKTSVVLIGQAPGPHEAHLGKPFAYTAGKTLFKWIHAASGVSEEDFRSHVYIAAVARCFPGKNLKGAGDREPTSQEIESCRVHLKEEIKILKPKLIIAVGRVAIAEVLGGKVFPKSKILAEVVGKKFSGLYHGEKVDVIPLPHPSGVSRWPSTEPGKTKLAKALALIGKNSDWREVFA